jgi:hypothetical protein
VTVISRRRHGLRGILQKVITALAPCWSACRPSALSSSASTRPRLTANNATHIYSLISDDAVKPAFGNAGGDIALGDPDSDRVFWDAAGRSALAINRVRGVRFEGERMIFTPAPRQVGSNQEYREIVWESIAPE